MGKTLHGTNYDWSKWLVVGKTTTLKAGKHYTCSDRTMTSYVYRVARRMKVKVVVSQPKEGVVKITAHTGDLDGRSRS